MRSLQKYQFGEGNSMQEIKGNATKMIQSDLLLSRNIIYSTFKGIDYRQQKHMIDIFCFKRCLYMGKMILQRSTFQLI